MVVVVISTLFGYPQLRSARKSLAKNGDFEGRSGDFGVGIANYWEIGHGWTPVKLCQGSGLSCDFALRCGSDVRQAASGADAWGAVKEFGLRRKQPSRLVLISGLSRVR